MYNVITIKNKEKFKKPERVYIMKKFEIGKKYLAHYGYDHRGKIDTGFMRIFEVVHCTPKFVTIEDVKNGRRSRMKVNETTSSEYLEKVMWQGLYASDCVE